MDNKTWGNLGGITVAGRNHQASLQHHLSGTASASVYPGTASLGGHTTSHWQRVTYCGAVNGLASSQTHLLSQQQHNQVQQQASQLRYFQVQKPTQYAVQPASSTSGINHQHNQSHHQHHYPHHYAVAAASPGLSSASSLTTNNSTIPNSSNSNERISYSGYRTNQFKSTDKSLARVSSPKTPEEDQTHDPHRSSNQQNSSPPSPLYRQRYKILTSGNFLIPANCQVSLTTCFALSSSTTAASTNPFVVEAAFSSSSSLPDPVSLLPRLIIPASAKSSLPRFVNAFEAVPDMLRDIRPGSTTFLATTTLTSIPYGQEEFSYHASKPRLSIRVEASIVARVENRRNKNWPELSLKTRRAVATIFEPIKDRVISADSERSVWKKISSLDESREPRISHSATRSHDKLHRARLRSCRILEKRKTYADAVQVTGIKKLTSSKLHRKFCEDKSTLDTNDSWTMNLRENRRPSKMCPSFFHTSTPKIELRGVAKKREYRESCEEENEYSSTSTASNGSYYGRSRTPETSSSPEVAGQTNWKELSPSSSLQEIDEDNSGGVAYEINERRRDKDVPSRKRLCKMAEMFCFGQLENPAFFRAFDEYNRRRRRMTYTQRLEDGTELDTTSFRKAVEAAEAMRDDVTLVSALSLGIKREFFGNETARYQNLGRANDNSMMSPIRINGINGINGMEEQGAFKILQKLKECADGNGAIYTNSWRPEELHFLRRCYQDKNI